MVLLDGYGDITLAGTHATLLRVVINTLLLEGYIAR